MRPLSLSLITAIVLTGLTLAGCGSLLRAPASATGAQSRDEITAADQSWQASSLPPLTITVTRLSPGTAWGNHGYSLSNRVPGDPDRRGGHFQVVRDPFHNLFPLQTPAAELDRFAFDLMEGDGVLTSNQVEFYSRMGQRIDERQISYVTLHERIPGRYDDPFMDDRGSLLSSVKLVAGQIREQKSGAGSNELVRRRLPWMAEFGQKDPDAGKFIFEASRVGNAAGRGLIGLNFSLMAYLAAQETLREGGKLEDASIYIHATTSKNAQTFETKYGFTPVKNLRLPPGHAVLVRRVSDMLRAYHPENLFYDLATVRDRLPAESDRAVEFTHRLEGLFSADIRTMAGGTQLAVKDLSFLYPLRLQALCQDYGVDVPAAEQLVAHQDRWFDTDHRHAFGEDFMDLDRENSMELSLDRAAEKRFLADPARYFALFWAEVESRVADLRARGIAVDRAKLDSLQVYFMTHAVPAELTALPVARMPAPIHDDAAAVRGQRYLFSIQGRDLKAIRQRGKLRDLQPRPHFHPRKSERAKHSPFE